MKVSRWKVDHHSDTEDDEDKAEGLPATPRVARCRFGGPAPVPVPLEPCLAEDEVVKKRALKRVKQQVSALHGELLPEGAQAREVTEILYQIPAVARDRKDCPVCEKSFKTHHHFMVHMGVNCGEKFPCSKCGKVLATRRMWMEQHKGLCAR